MNVLIHLFMAFARIGAFTFGGGYTRTDGNKKNDFEWIDCSLLKIDGQELIGPNAGKDGKKEESFSRPKALKAQVKVKRGGKFTVELNDANKGVISKGNNSVFVDINIGSVGNPSEVFRKTIA